MFSPYGDAIVGRTGEARGLADLILPGPLQAVAGLDDETTRAQTSHEGLMAKRRLGIVPMKPSHHDDDGYVIQWRSSTIPSNRDIEFQIYDECKGVRIWMRFPLLCGLV